MERNGEAYQCYSYNKTARYSFMVFSMETEVS